MSRRRARPPTSEAILEQEKPDPAKIAARKDSGRSVAPAPRVTAAELAQFYYDRGAARALLGRNQEALDDGLKALDAAKKSGEFLRVTRVMQFVALRYRALGEPRKEAELSMRSPRRRGRKQARRDDQCAGESVAVRIFLRRD